MAKSLNDCINCAVISAAACSKIKPSTTQSSLNEAFNYYSDKIFKTEKQNDQAHKCINDAKPMECLYDPRQIQSPNSAESLKNYYRASEISKRKNFHINVMVAKGLSFLSPY